MTTTEMPTFTKLITSLADVARTDGRFKSVEVEDGMLCCAASASAEPAEYRIQLDQGQAWVSLVMKDRWQSESIESDLLHSGDKVEELIEEELVDLGYEGKPLTVQHFRSEDLLFTFRSPLPIDPATEPTDDTIDTVKTCLYAYEACFAQLGDMTDDGDDD